MGLSSILVSLVLTLGCVRADIYLHVPRGSNNRLNEVTATRKNANRLFDSENNNRGGYNVGDATKDPARSKEEKQYKMKYFQSSEGEGLTYLTLQWTNQHGCGGNEDTDGQQQNCNLVLQYMCQDDSGSNIDARDALRNGVQTSRQIYTKPPSRRDTPARREKRRKGNVRPQRGLHESWDWYDRCYVRNRNNGLFTADQILKRNRKGDRSAVFTRQNPTGNQYGYECPEERDYFPYWHPTPWKDIAVLAQNASICSFYQSESFNVKSYGQCVETYAGGATKWASKWNNAGDCKENGGRWVVLSNYLEKASDLTSQSACLSSRRGGHRHIWAVPYETDDVTRKECLVALEKPRCSEAPWTRPNHLGNGRGGYPVNYTWALPHFPSGNTQRCVIRMRYNISTNDYDPYNTDARHNNNIKTGVVSPVTNDPSVDLGVGDISLRLAINTAQYGRVFQDRSHVFILRPRPTALQDKVIYNLNVLGKRGNIVQVFPAVEYDFYPTDLQIKEGDLVHIQWTGSNTHLNKGAGNDGEGKAGTDRSNMVQINSLNKNIPVPYTESTMWKNAEVVWHYGISDTSRLSGRDLAVVVATSGYNSCETREVCGTKSAEATKKVDGQLNNAPASFEGVVVKFQKGVYYYMCTRNNNFTNRNQKGTIRVS